MNSKRLFFVLVGVNLLFTGLLFAGAYAINASLTAQKDKIVEKRSSIAALDGQSVGLIKAKKDVTTYSELGAIAKAVVPQDKDQAQTVRELVAIAGRSGIKLSSISFPTSSLGAAKPVVGAPTTTNLTLSQLLPVQGIPGVYSLEIIVQSDKSSPVTYDRFLAFLGALENNRRTALVSTISLSPDSKDSSKLSFNLTLDEYIKP